MKRFVISVLSISVFFVGLGSLAEHVGARFKSDEKALEIVRRTRIALGGEAALAEVRSMVITGRTVNTFKVGDAERSEPGETEIAIQFPDKMSQRIKIGTDDGTGIKNVTEQHNVVVVSKGGDASKIHLDGGNGEFTTADGKKIVIKERVAGGDATFTSEDGKKVVVRQIESGEAGSGAAAWKMKSDSANGDEKHMVFARSAGEHGGMKQNDLLRLSLALLLKAPDGIDVSYTFGGETDIDGIAVNIVNAEFGGSSYKLFIGKTNSLPVAMSYSGMGMPKVFHFTKGDAAAADAGRDQMMITKKIGADAGPVEKLVKFSDYRSTGSVQLPYKWTTSVGGNVRETFDVTTFDINPSNIAERFKDQKVLVRTKKPDGQ